MTLWHVPSAAALWMLLEMPSFRFRNSLYYAVSSNERSGPLARCDNASDSICQFFLCFHEKGYSVPREVLCTRTFTVDSNSYKRIILIITAVMIIII
jgi:hypothetical protein